MALRQQNFLLQRYLEKAMVDLPALPTVIIQVLQATENEQVTINEIEEMITTDVAITTKILKVVNSAYFGLPRQVMNIGQAVGILGIHQTRNLVLSLGVLNALASPNARVMEMQRQFWQHSFGAAHCARSIAAVKRLAAKDQESAFVGGLLHDIGRLFLLTLFNQPYSQVLTEAVSKGIALAEVEDRVLNTTHAELGGTLAERWNFPGPLIEMIRFHDDVSSRAGDPSAERLYCIHAADRLASELWQGTEAAVLFPFDPTAEQWLGFGPAQWEELKEGMAASVEKAEDLLRIL